MDVETPMPAAAPPWCSLSDRIGWNPTRITGNFLILAAIWTLAVAASLAWNLHELRQPMERHCLHCFTGQGYQKGDVQGGLSLSLPLPALYLAECRRPLAQLLGHLFLWTVGLMGLRIVCRRLSVSLSQEEQIEISLQEANERLIEMIYDFCQRNREASLLNEMSDQLQLCTQVEEAHQIAARFLPQFFQKYGGSFLILHPEEYYLEVVTSWNISPGESLVSDPSTCLALRRGSPYVMVNPEQDVICEHLSRPLAPGYLCIPMIAHGKGLGVLHLRALPDGCPEDLADFAMPFPEASRHLGRTIAEHLALSLASLRLQETLRQQAIRDPLTDLFNRRFMEETLNLEIHRVLRRGVQLGVVLLDLDKFKAFNDLHGHPAGDKMLTLLGNLLKSQVRKGDIACRYGGEEFVLILPEASLEVAVQRAETIRSLTADLRVQHDGKSLQPLTVSLGVAVCPDHGATPDTLLQAADKAMYQAKQAGGNRVATAES